MERRNMKRKDPYPEDGSNYGKKRCMIEPSEEESAIQPANQQYFPIASLKETFSCPKIKGRLTEVSEWMISRNEVKFLVFRLRDESGVIKGLAFDPMGADFHKNFKLGATVILKNSKVQVEANKSDRTKSYKLIVNRFTLIKIESISPVPPKPLRTMIRDVLDSSNERDVIDVLGILVDIGELERNTMREVRIVDESEANIILTLWDESAKNLTAPVGSVVVANRVAVRIYNSTKCLRTCRLSQLLFDPPIDDTRRLKQWYSEWRSAATVTTENENSTMFIENTVHGTTDSGITENRRVEIADSDASTSTSTRQGNYVSIETLLNSPAGAVVDIVGFVVNQNPPMQRHTKSGNLEWMKVVILTNGRNCQMELTVWGDEVKECNIPCNSVITAKNVVVQHFGDTKALTGLGMNLQIEPNIPETTELRQLIRNNSVTNEMEYPVIAASSRCPVNSLHRGNITTIKEINKMTTANSKRNIVALVANCEPPVEQQTKSKKITWMGSPDNALHCGNITTIKEIDNSATAGSRYNIVALVTSCEPPVENQTKSGKITWMRTVMLADEKDSNIEMTIWGDAVRGNKIQLHSVISARGVMVRVFNNKKTLSCLWGHLQIEPNVPQAATLRKLIPENTATNETENTVIAASSRTLGKSLHRRNITTIKEINNTATAGFKYNIAALVVECNPPEERTTKAGKLSWMRTVMLTDEKNIEIELAIWGDAVRGNKIPLHSVIMATDVTVRDFNDKKTLCCLWVHLQIEPNVPQAATLRNLIPENTATNETENTVIAASSRTLGNSLHCGNITAIKEINDTATAGSKYNIVALVIECNSAVERITNHGKVLWKTTVMLTDEKNIQIEMAIWDDAVRDNKIPLHSVIMARDVMVRDFNDKKTLRCLWVHLQIEPDVPQAATLRNLIPENTATSETQNTVIVASSRILDNSLHCGNITTIKEIQNAATAGLMYNILALAVECNPPEERKTKAGKLSWMRTVMLTDEKNIEIELAIWGDAVRGNKIPLHSVIMARHVTVRDFNDKKTLCCLWVHLQIEPNVPQAATLRNLIPENAATNETQNTVIVASSKIPGNSLHRGNITTIKEINNMKTAGFKYNIVALVVECNPPEKRKTKSGKLSWMRTVILTDEENIEIELTIWGDAVRGDKIPLHSIIMARDVTVRDFNNMKTLSCLWGHLQIEPNVPQAATLRKLIPENSRSPGHSLRRGRITTLEVIHDTATVDSKHNIVALVIECKPPEERKTKAKKVTWMRTVMLTDEKSIEIEMAIWGNAVAINDIPLYSVIMARGVLVRDYNSKKTLSCLWEHLEINPDVPQAEKLAKFAIVHRNITRKRTGYNDFHTFEQIQNSLKETDEISELYVIGLVTKTKPSMKLKLTDEENEWLTKFILEDTDGNEIDLLVFSDEPLKSAIPLNSVLVVEGAEAVTVKDRITLSAFEEFITINPNIPEAHRLKQIEMISPRSDFREYADEEARYYTPIEVIRRSAEPNDCLNTIGLVVEANPPAEPEKLNSSKNPVRKCVLRGRDGSDIELKIISYPCRPFEIPLNSVIVARDATVQESEDKKKLTLTCHFADVEFDTNVPESKGFKKDVPKTSKFQVEKPETQDCNVFTAFKKIKETRVGTTLNVLGLVVDVINRSLTLDESDEEDSDESFTIRVTLRDTDLALINLYITNTRETDKSIRIKSVIAARDATLRHCDGDKVLWCLRNSVEIDPDIPEAEKSKLAVLGQIPFVRSFMPFTTIFRTHSLVECTVSIIGQVVAIGSTLEVENSEEDDTCFVATFILRNEIDIPLFLWGIDKLKLSLNKDDPISLNSIIAGKDALIGFRYGRIELNVYWRNVTINARTPDTDRGAQSLAIVQIKRILEEGRVGEKFGILAVVENLPRKIGDCENIIESKGSEKEGRRVSRGELGRECVKLIDSSGETITMTMPFSLAERLRKNSEKTVVIRARNLQVYSHEGKVELAFTSTESWIDINPKTAEAFTLLKWYDLFCEQTKGVKIKEACHDITSIDLILENCADGSRASVMGILIASDMYENGISDQQLESRRIQIIDDSEHIINILLWNSAAADFNVPLYSIIVVMNFYFYVKGERKWGDFGPETDYAVPTAEENYLEQIQRLESWFAHYCAQSENLSTDESSSVEENPILLLNSIKVEKNPNDIEMVEGSENTNEDSRMVHGNHCSLSQNYERILASSCDNHSIEDDSDSSDIFADC